MKLNIILVVFMVVSMAMSAPNGVKNRSIINGTGKQYDAYM